MHRAIAEDGLPTAGMGDALTGMLTSFLAQGIPEWEAANAAVYIHGLAGDIASKEHTQRALITSDLIKAVGAAIKTVEL